MSHEYETRFTRYRNSTRVVSAEVSYFAESFDDAVHQANTLLQGMRSVDSESEFDIESIRSAGLIVSSRGRNRQSIWEMDDDAASDAA